MKPIGPLMHEHRLIERMIAIIGREKERITATNTLNAVLIDTVVDFIRIYADKTHHGKEEDILFRDLLKKKMTPDHEKIMQELIDEHKFARKVTGDLVQAKENYLKDGKEHDLDVIVGHLNTLIEFYPEHIRKEDKDFFFPILDYFTKEEQDAMLKEFDEFDRNMIHMKYKSVVETYEK
ncbi:MAG: hemerythrin domain-containing protein [Deltaproteobacteria bacterium]|uniref:Hemerythrin domain-containing protein n=1 Tax=Candidatus Zymogenus saltonus TaxID=2844893 RepID=A0A9D8KI15_9DELT|nr:hemerythrin domain-containing protein [Candidatus Zymogenus saltonus]